MCVPPVEETVDLGEQYRGRGVGERRVGREHPKARVGWQVSEVGAWHSRNLRPATGVAKRGIVVLTAE